MSRWPAAALALFAASCAPSSQVLLYVDTDAPEALFDRLRIDVLDDAGETRETREVAVSGELFRAQRVSFGVATPVAASGYSVRLRLFRSASAATREPPPSSTIDAVVTLPPLDLIGVRALTALLETESIGVERSIDAAAGAPPGSRIGSWDGAAERPCAGEPRAEEACVPGGAFLLGDPRIVGLLPQIDTPAERLVLLDAYFLDTHEVTVADFRRQMSQFPPSTLLDPIPQKTPFDPRQHDSWCLWTDAPGPNEALPMNCIGRDLARGYCRSLGKDLPSEAQLEFVASGRGAERAYVWGNDEPGCGDAVWGLAGAGGAMSAMLAASYDGTCLPPSSSGAPSAPGGGARDRVQLGNREVVDLAGNVSEWVLDAWSRNSEAYWSGPGVLRNPVADLRSEDDEVLTARGGFWYGTPISLRAGYRSPQLADSYSNGLGFRCAR